MAGSALAQQSQIGMSPLSEGRNKLTLSQEGIFLPDADFKKFLDLIRADARLSYACTAAIVDHRRTASLEHRKMEVRRSRAAALWARQEAERRTSPRKASPRLQPCRTAPSLRQLTPNTSSHKIRSASSLPPSLPLSSSTSEPVLRHPPPPAMRPAPVMEGTMATSCAACPSTCALSEMSCMRSRGVELLKLRREALLVTKLVKADEACWPWKTAAMLAACQTDSHDKLWPWRRTALFQLQRAAEEAGVAAAELLQPDGRSDRRPHRHATAAIDGDMQQLQKRAEREAAMAQARCRLREVRVRTQRHAVLQRATCAASGEVVADETTSAHSVPARRKPPVVRLRTKGLLAGPGAGTITGADSLVPVLASRP